jgi:hypothetical protein
VLGTVVMLAAYVADLLSVPIEGVAIGLCTLGIAGTFVPRVEQWLPERRCQVAPFTVFRFSAQGAAFRWGLQLGMGFHTYMVVPAVLALPAAALLQRTPIAEWAIFLSYGLSRGGIIACMAVAGARSRGRDKAEPAIRWPLKRMLRVPLGVVMIAMLIVGVATM